MSTSGIAKTQETEKQQLEDSTKLTVEYNENGSFTIKDELEIKILQENIKKLTLNWKDVNIEGNGFTYNYPLALWNNTISIVGSNWGIERKLNKTIERIAKEEEEKRVKLEQEKAELAKINAEEDRKKSEAAAKKQIELTEQERVRKALERINKEIDSITKYDWSAYRDSVTSIQIEIALFSAYASLVDEYINDVNPTVKKAAIQFKARVSALQKKEFPKMRKSYADLVGATMWEHNIKVATLWNSNSTIELVWGIFANNKNVKESYLLLSDMLKALRFDRVNFKWYKYDDEYNYYDIESSPDDKVEQIK